MVKKSSLRFNHPQNLQKPHCKRCISKKIKIVSLFNPWTGKKKVGGSLIEHGQFGNFYKVILGIKICYGGAGRWYGGGGRIRLFKGGPIMGGPTTVLG